MVKPNNRTATINITGYADGIARADHVWRDSNGVLCASLDFGNSCWLTYHDPAQLRELAAAAAGLADLMDKFPPVDPAGEQ